MNDQYEASLTRLLDGLDASANVRELARGFAHRAFAAELQTGHSPESIAASAVYAAFRRDGDTRTLDEVTAVADVNRTSIGRAYKDLADELNIDLAPADPHEFVERFAASFDMSARVEAMAHDIVDESVEAGLLSGVAPAGLAAGALYLADSEHHNRLDQQDIADVAGVTVVTLRHRYAEQTTLIGDGEHGSVPSQRRHLLGMD
jgi:transcription initiation factor TFIIB